MEYSVHSNVHIFAFVCVDLWGPTPECETSVSELPLLFAIDTFSLKSAYHQTTETTQIQNGSHANSGPERSTHAMKQRIYLIYLTI